MHDSWGLCRSSTVAITRALLCLDGYFVFNADRAYVRRYVELMIAKKLKIKDRQHSGTKREKRRYGPRHEKWLVIVRL